LNLPTLQDEFLDDAGPFCTLEEAQTAVDRWREQYNHRRPHQSLDMACPADKFRPSAGADDGLALWALADLDTVTTAVPAPEAVGGQPRKLRERQQTAVSGPRMDRDASTMP